MLKQREVERPSLQSKPPHWCGNEQIERKLTESDTSSKGTMAGLDWGSIGVAWVLSVGTLLIIYSVVHLIRCLRRRANKKRKKNHYSSNISHVSDSLIDKRDLTTCDQSEKRVSTWACPQRPKCQSVHSESEGRPSPTAIHSSSVKSGSNSDRRKRDDITVWCNDQGLPECFVQYLRQSGFATREALDNLRTSDISILSLPSAAMLVQMRRVLEKRDLHRVDENVEQQPKPQQPQPSLRSSDSVESSSPVQSPPDSDAVFFERRGFSRPDGSSGKGSNMSQNCSSNSKRSNSRPQSIDNAKGFRGLLSNSGLWELVDKLGYDWRHLATLLGLSTTIQEQLMESHPHATRQCIYDMLRLWRDTIAQGSKESIKGTLYNALMSIRRRDIAEMVMREQVNGSKESVHSTVRSVI